jgi:hypothetical protein
MLAAVGISYYPSRCASITHLLRACLPPSTFFYGETAEKLSCPVVFGSDAVEHDRLAHTTLIFRCDHAFARPSHYTSMLKNRAMLNRVAMHVACKHNCDVYASESVE